LDTSFGIVFSFQRMDNLSRRQLLFYDPLQKRIEAAGLRILPESRATDRIEDRALKFLNAPSVSAGLLAISQAWDEVP
jgi:hypothetical protein